MSVLTQKEVEDFHTLSTKGTWTLTEGDRYWELASRVAATIAALREAERRAFEEAATQLREVMEKEDGSTDDDVWNHVTWLRQRAAGTGQT